MLASESLNNDGGIRWRACVSAPSMARCRSHNLLRMLLRAPVTMVYRMRAHRRQVLVLWARSGGITAHHCLHSFCSRCWDSRLMGHLARFALEGVHEDGRRTGGGRCEQATGADPFRRRTGGAAGIGRADPAEAQKPRVPLPHQRSSRASHAAPPAQEYMSPLSPDHTTT